MISPAILYWFIHGNYERYIWILDAPFPFSHGIVYSRNKLNCYFYDFKEKSNIDIDSGWRQRKQNNYFSIYLKIAFNDKISIVAFDVYMSKITYEVGE